MGKKTTKVNDEIAAMVKKIIDFKTEYRQSLLAQGDIPPALDLRDFTSKDLIYGIKTIPIEDAGKIDTETYNWGRCFAYDYIVPTYKFFRFKNMYKVLCNLYDECNGAETDDNKHNCVFWTIHGIFDTLSNMETYSENWHGRKRDCRFKIFLYGGVEYANNLTRLAEKFRERDLKEAQAVTAYHNSRLVETLGRIKESLDARQKGAGK
jgi:hypothetical protein